MNSPKKIQSKTTFHPRNKHQGFYDFEKIKKSCPELAEFIQPNKFNDISIDFANPKAVKTLNKALLIHQYGLSYWEIPPNFLCPPIPGRADYIHYVADLLSIKNQEKIPRGGKIKCLDIGVGANCIYPIIGNREYDWSFIGADIDTKSIQSANKIVTLNPLLKGKIELRFQKNSIHFFEGILKDDEKIDVTICNPPFHSSLEEATKGSIRKVSNLSHQKIVTPVLNFGGKSNELWVKGGEAQFVQKMILESKKFATSCLWFTSLISKSEHLKAAYLTLEKVKAVEIKTIEMGQGNKISRFIAWTFLSEKEQIEWTKKWK